MYYFNNDVIQISISLKLTTTVTSHLFNIHNSFTYMSTAQFIHSHSFSLKKVKPFIVSYTLVFYEFALHVTLLHTIMTAAHHYSSLATVAQLHFPPHHSPLYPNKGVWVTLKWCHNWFYVLVWGVFQKMLCNFCLTHRKNCPNNPGM